MIAGLLGCLGLLLLLYRMGPRRFKPCSALPDDWPLVSIIVPARNEERVLAQLLRSLERLDYPAYEVIVVDDRSEDATAELAAGFPVRVISGQERPAGWNGKQWACHQGAQAALGSYLLFTDADTVHHPTGLRRTMREIVGRQAQALTVLPRHLSPRFWEKLCGPFHVFLLAVTHPYGKPRPGQVFAIGQYLLFERSFYESIGGHGRVRADWVEDIPLAEAVLADGGRWQVYTGPTVCSVRMYESIREFVRGWRRNFRAGMSYSYWGAPVEITLFMAAASGAGRWSEPYAWLLMVATALVLLWTQRRLGHFSAWGVVLLPFSLGLFCCISILAAFDRLLKRPMHWKNRAYTAPQSAV